jgi:site-specific recombinase XerD
MDMNTLAQDFLVYLEAERGYSRLTASAYRSDLGQFFTFLATHEYPENAPDVTATMVRQWIVAMKRRDLSARTIARHIHALRSFWRYLLDVEAVQHDPLRKITAPKLPKRLPQYLNADGLRAILDAAQRQRLTFCAFRDYAMMATLIFTGMRRGELLDLKLGDVDLAQASARIENGKGGRTRVVPLVEDAVQAIGDWLGFRPKRS